MRCLTSSIFFSHNEEFDWPITQKENETKRWRLPKIEGSILKCRVLPFGPKETLHGKLRLHSPSGK
jgi:hypothetical protein